MKKFIQPVSMQVTKEQYEKDLKQPLKDLGYSSGFFTNKYPILVNNLAGSIGQYSDIDFDSRNKYNRYFIDHYNPELFLAICAMNSETCGISGEYWVYIGNSDIKDFTINKLYKSRKSLNNYSVFIDDFNNINGFFVKNIINFRKVTLKELIENFNIKEYSIEELKSKRNNRDWVIKVFNKKQHKLLENIFPNIASYTEYDDSYLVSFNNSGRANFYLYPDTAYNKILFNQIKEFKNMKKYTKQDLLNDKSIHVICENKDQWEQLCKIFPDRIKSCYSEDNASYCTDHTYLSSKATKDYPKYKSWDLVYFKDVDFEDKKIVGYKIKEDLINKYNSRNTLLKTIAQLGLIHKQIKEEYPNEEIILKAIFESNAVRSNFKKAGVFDLWFEPVYEELLKIDDWVVVTKAYGTNYAKIGTIGKIKTIDDASAYKYNIYNSPDFEGSSWCINVRKATPEEIEKANIEIIKMNDNFSLTLKNNKIYHKNDDITDFVLGVRHLWENTLTNGKIKIDTYDFIIDSINLSKCGCEVNSTNIKQWLELANKLK